MDKKRLAKIEALKRDARGKVKDKSFDKMTRLEKDELLETLCKMLGIIK